jgi:hypothetical protein
MKNMVIFHSYVSLLDGTFLGHVGMTELLDEWRTISDGWDKLGMSESLVSPGMLEWQSDPVIFDWVIICSLPTFDSFGMSQKKQGELSQLSHSQMRSWITKLYNMLVDATNVGIYSSFKAGELKTSKPKLIIPMNLGKIWNLLVFPVTC